MISASFREWKTLPSNFDTLGTQVLGSASSLDSEGENSENLNLP